MTSFFSHSEDAAKFLLYGPGLDLDYARKHLAPLEGLGEPIRGVHNNYPYYLGVNAEFRARGQSHSSPAF